MNPNTLRLLALLAQSGMVAGGLGMLVDHDNKADPKTHSSYQDYLEDESIPLEEKIKKVEQLQKYKYEDSPAGRHAKLGALKKLREGR